MAKTLDTDIQISQFQNSNDVKNRHDQTEDVINTIEDEDIPDLESMYSKKMKFIQQDIEGEGNTPAYGNEESGMGWFILV